MDKDRIQQVADRLAQERYGKGFYELPDVIQRGICVLAEQEVIDQDAAMGDAMKEREKYG